MAKGMCSKCYYRVKRGGTPELSIKQKMALRKCEVDGCNKPHKSLGLCINHYQEKVRKENPELKYKEYQNLKTWRKLNKDKDSKYKSEYRERNKERLKSYFKIWISKNRNSYNAYQATRKKRVKLATPKWADLDAIRNFYLNCPEDHHVDHIIPLNGKNVSGLHVLNNLQYLPKLENLRKSNKF